MIFQKTIEVATRQRGLLEITDRVQAAVAETGLSSGLANIFIHHTSASLIISENADPDVLRDLETLLARMAPDADPDYLHTAEGPDDMAAHMRTVLTATSLSIPVTQGRCALGTWQGLYLWEHRETPHQRTLTITMTG